ncbi:T9SS type A sorting domain-containing protein [Seonamhaeicola sp.]|uniref:T9SS type A sorting domain-containing protein n=1 Tax=Seonamhaeicola sp. TaxID=1912245 RepID=UPI00261F3E34|nr:T9SS type A sorting domain-containing protein [Seonamhaeicola sp.]
MKKLYFFICCGLLAISLNAQETIFDPDFEDGTYTGVGAVETDLDAHADWIAGHFGNANTWVAFTTGGGTGISVVRTGAYFTYTIADKAITGSDGDIITIRTVMDYGFAGQSFGTTAGENLIFTGLLDRNNPASGSEGNVPNRDGVMVVNRASINEIALSSNNGGSSFSTEPSLPTSESGSHLFEVIVEYTIGNSAATSSKKAYINDINGTNGSSTSSVATELAANVYNALTGSGAYFFNWALAFGTGDSNLSHLHLRSLTITKNAPLLSTNNKDAFEFAMYPNPVRDILHINTLEPIKKVEVYDLLGKSVLTQYNVLDQVDVSSLNKALYIVKLTSDNGVSTKKFIKE